VGAKGQSPFDGGVVASLVRKSALRVQNGKKLSDCKRRYGVTQKIEPEGGDIRLLGGKGGGDYERRNRFRNKQRFLAESEREGNAELPVSYPMRRREG